MTEWGVHNFGASLLVNKSYDLDVNKLLFVDVETDEKDGFVGIGYMQEPSRVYFSSNLYTLSRQISTYLNQGGKLVGHNLKFDAKLLVKWGVDVKPEHLQDDTILMSYTINATKESHSLKDLGKELGYEWPTYSEMVHPDPDHKHKKVTLDAQDVHTVANYCAMDVLVTYKLYEKFIKQMDLNQRRVYQQIEMPLMRILFEMELQGVLVDVEKLQHLGNEFSKRLNSLTESLRAVSGCPTLNPNSNKQIAEILEGRGITLETTQKGNKKVDKFTLEKHQEDDLVKTLIEYNKLEKLVSTYTGGLLKRETLPKVYTTYNQVTGSGRGSSETGISTGRLSSSNPNLQQIPTRTEEGKLLRELFIGLPGHVLIDADYSQIEYRLLAHFTKEPVLLEAFRTGQDVHEATGKIIGCDRDMGKKINFSVIYGAGAEKIAQSLNRPVGEAEQILKKYWSKLPSVTAWITRVKHEATKKGGVFTLMKRWIPIDGFDSRNKYDRWGAERKAVNYLIQGSAAEIIKMAMIQLKSMSNFLPLLTVHDELLFESDGANTEEVECHAAVIKSIMEDVVKLDVPLVADVGIGNNWREAKGD